MIKNCRIELSIALSMGNFNSTGGYIILCFCFYCVKLLQHYDRNRQGMWICIYIYLVIK